MAKNQTPNSVKSSASSYGQHLNSMYPMFGDGFFTPNADSQDFASLPPMVNMMGNSSEHENNSTDVLNGSGSMPNMSRDFNFSDPCLINTSEMDSRVSDRNLPDSRFQQQEGQNDTVDANKFFGALMEQMTLLHETNSKIVRELQETKVDIEALKHTPTWGMRHRRDSLSGLSTQSQPMVFGAGFGRQSPAPTYHSGNYAPGMMTDVVREVREAARVREEAMLNRLKTFVEERQFSMNENNLRLMREIEGLKFQVLELREDRKDLNKRVMQLEAENKCMRQMMAVFSQRSAHDVIHEHEVPPHTTRSNPKHVRRAQTLNLKYGTIHQQPAMPAAQNETLHSIGTNPSTTTATAPQQTARNIRKSSSSSTEADGCEVVRLANGSGTKAVPASSPPSFALISTPEEEMKSKKEKTPPKPPQRTAKVTEDVVVAQQDSDSAATAAAKLTPQQQLQHELSAAVEARKDADLRIIALENLVKNLQKNAIHPTEVVTIPYCVGSGDGGGGDGGGGGTNVGGAGVGGLNNMMTSTTLPYTIWQSAPVTTYSPGSRQHQAQTVVSSSVNVTHSPPKLSVAGPITDL